MRLAGFKLPVDRLSASSLATFMTCPEQFRLEKIKKIRSRRGMSGFVGSVHHGAVETLLRRKISQDMGTEAEVLTSAYEGSWLVEMEEEEPEWEELPDQVAKRGLLMLDSFVTTALPSITPIGVEEWIEERIPGIPVPVVGYIDCYEQARTLEFKTAKQKVSEPKAKWRAQQRIYQLFTELPTDFVVTTRQVTPVTYMPENAPSLHLALGSADATVVSLVQAVEQMNDLYARYGPDRVWPLNGLMHQYQCGYCPAGPKSPSPICPAWRLSDQTAA